MIAAFIGKIDDGRLYNATLSAGEVAYVATQNTSGSGAGHVPLLIRANIQISIYGIETNTVLNLHE
jgi:hypothetical protein